MLVDELVLLKKSVSVPQHKHGLLVFGGVDEDTKLELESAFKIRFSHERCLGENKLMLLPLPANVLGIRR